MIFYPVQDWTQQYRIRNNKNRTQVCVSHIPTKAHEISDNEENMVEGGGGRGGGGERGRGRRKGGKICGDDPV